MLLTRTERACPRLIIEVVAVVSPVGPFLAMHGMARAAALAEAGRYRGKGTILELASLGIL